ncbi:MAG: radical SAM protein [Thermoanaerobaculia bacterium]
MRPSLRWKRAFGLLVEPVPKDKRELLAERWRELDPQWRGPLQGLGRQSTGCGATIGLNPRCDFDCAGCYLGGDANAVPRAPAAEISRQLAALRRHLGPKGNLQLTDGEVTLLPEPELLGVVREARRLGLIPMLMTHGDGLRRTAGLLDRLVEAGLTEIALHVDSLQRGRRGPYREARTEAELEPLRDELAEIVRETRRRTGVRLRVAATLTVARSNLAEIGAVVDGLFRRRDVFGLVSLQPLARVGRTRESLEGVTREELWEEVGNALAPYGFDAAGTGRLRFGHPDCTRVEPLLVVERPGERPQVLPVLRPGRIEDERFVAGFLDSPLAGLAFRDDPPLERTMRILGAFSAAPAFVLREILPWVRGRAAESGLPLARLAFELLRGGLRIDAFQVVSHHFMSREEATTERGRERIAACLFRVPVGGRMVSMCEANALGIRDRFYGELAATSPARSASLPVAAAGHLGSP